MPASTVRAALRRPRRLAVLLVAALMSMLAPRAFAASGPPRLALVIANRSYCAPPAPPNAATDGDTISAALTAAKFLDASGAGPVKPRRDLDEAGLRRELELFRRALAEAGPEAFGLVYFSGHGVSVGSYGDAAMALIDQGPTLQPGMVTRATLTDQLLGAGARTIVVVLDMCRSAVEAPAIAPSGGLTQVANITGGAVSVPAGSKGLARYAPSQRRPDQGYLVAYSTSPDQVAFDSGVFSRILAEEIRRPAPEHRRGVQARVRPRRRCSARATKAWQKPTFDYGLQGDPPCFVSLRPRRRRQPLQRLRRLPLDADRAAGRSGAGFAAHGGRSRQGRTRPPQRAHQQALRPVGVRAHAFGMGGLRGRRRVPPPAQLVEGQPQPADPSHAPQLCRRRRLRRLAVGEVRATLPPAHGG